MIMVMNGQGGGLEICGAMRKTQHAVHRRIGGLEVLYIECLNCVLFIAI